MPQEQQASGVTGTTGQVPKVNKVGMSMSMGTITTAAPPFTLRLAANISYITGVVFCLLALYFSYVMAEQAIRVDYFVEWKLLTVGLTIANGSQLVWAVLARWVFKSDFYRPAMWVLLSINMLALAFVTMVVAVLYAD